MNGVKFFMNAGKTFTNILFLFIPKKWVTLQFKIKRTI